MNKKKRISKNDIKTAKRLLKYVTETYKFRFVLDIYLYFDQCGSKYFRFTVVEIYAG